MDNKLQVRDQFALVPSNPRIVAIAQGMRLKPATLVRQIERALPAPVEQQLYLSLVPGYRLRPSSLAYLLRTYLGHRNLGTHDLEVKTVGENLRHSKFDEVSDFLQQALDLIMNRDQFSITLHDAAVLALHFGDKVTEVLDSIEANLGEVRERFGIRLRQSASVEEEARVARRTFGIAISYLVSQIEEGLDRGRTIGIDVSEYLWADRDEAEMTMNRLVGEYDDDGEQD